MRSIVQSDLVTQNKATKAIHMSNLLCHRMSSIVLSTVLHLRVHANEVLDS